MVGRGGSETIRRIGAYITVAIAVLIASAVTGYSAGGDDVRPLSDFSPALLGTYRKVMNVEREIVKYASQYGVDVSLARAVCMFESGGNPNLTSSAGAKGLFQVMPATFRLMHVKTNIEAGIKYLGQLVRQLGTEDYAVAAYNGGPGRVARRRPMPLESLQYVIGVGIYRSALREHEPAIRKYASALELTYASEDDTWWTLAERIRVPVVQLRLHNPFLADRPLRAGTLVVYPTTPRTDLFTPRAASAYLTRVGDNYLKIARALGVDPDLMRAENGLWRLQPTLPGTALTIPRARAAGSVSYTVREHDTVPRIADRLGGDPWWVVRDNYLWDEVLTPGEVLRVQQRRAVAPPSRVAEPRIHRVRRGDTLTNIARRYGTTVKALQAANGMGRRTALAAGQPLKIGN